MWFTTPVTGFVLMIAMTQSKYATIKSKAQLKKSLMLEDLAEHGVVKVALE
jgi:hypothetical protein